MSAETCVSFTALSAGIYCSGYDPQMNAKNGFPVFSTHIEANYISKSTDAWNVYKLTDEDRQKITALAADPRIGEGTSHTDMVCWHAGAVAGNSASTALVAKMKQLTCALCSVVACCACCDPVGVGTVLQEHALPRALLLASTVMTTSRWPWPWHCLVA